jgi:uncharacterized protein (DUF58 family)
MRQVPGTEVRKGVIETLTGRVSGEAGAFLILLLAGLALGNAALVYISLVPFLFLVFSLSRPGPEAVVVTRTGDVATVLTNQAVSVSVDLTSAGGPGIVTVADSLPEHFQLTEGNNFHVYWQDGRNLPVQLSYAVRCTRRGIYDLGPAHVECFQSSWLSHRAFDSTENASRLIVRPQSASISKIRDPRLRSSMPMPYGAVYKLGVRTTDFMQIREYCHGDPYSSINWKATARLSGGASAKPLVNEFEKEGKKTVMIFIDAGAQMKLGSTVDNVFEHAIEAAAGIASFYLDRGLRVGVYAYNYGEYILPDTGRKQASLISRSLIDIQMDDTPAGDTNRSEDNDNCLREAVIECSGHLSGSNPLFFVITMVDKNNTKDVIDGIRSMHRYSFNPRMPQVIVLDILGYGLAATGDCEKAAATLLELDDKPCVRLVRKVGALVVPFNPVTQNVSQVMMASFGRRSR